MLSNFQLRHCSILGACIPLLIIAGIHGKLALNIDTIVFVLLALLSPVCAMLLDDPPSDKPIDTTGYKYIWRWDICGIMPNGTWVPDGTEALYGAVSNRLGAAYTSIQRSRTPPADTTHDAIINATDTSRLRAGVGSNNSSAPHANPEITADYDDVDADGLSARVDRGITEDERSELIREHRARYQTLTTPVEKQEWLRELDRLKHTIRIEYVSGASFANVTNSLRPQGGFLPTGEWVPDEQEVLHGARSNSGNSSSAPHANPEPVTPEDANESFNVNDNPIESATAVLRNYLDRVNNSAEEVIERTYDVSGVVDLPQHHEFEIDGYADIGGHATTVEGRRIPVAGIDDYIRLWSKFNLGGKESKGDEEPPKLMKLTMRYATPAGVEKSRQAGYNVRGGRGIPSYLTDSLILLDLSRTKVSCAIQCAILHMLMWTLDPTTSKPTSLFNSYSHMGFRSIYRSLLKDMSKVKVPLHWCTDDIAAVLRKLSYKFADIIVYQYHEGNENDETAARSLRHEDFNGTTMHVWITRGNHAQLLAHQDNIEIHWKQRIADITKRTWYQQIRKPKTKSTPYLHINTLDTEAYEYRASDGKRVLRTGLLCAVYQGQRVPAFKSDEPITDFVRWFLTLGTSAEFWVHNVSYDGRFFFSAIVPYLNNMLDRPVEPLSNKHGFISLNFHLINGHSLKLRCSLKQLPQSLKELGPSYLADRPDLWKQDYNVLERCHSMQDLWSEECVEYCYRDCECLAGVLHAYQDVTIHKYNMNPLRYASSSSYAKNSWYLHGYDPDAFPLYTLSEDVDTKLRMGYNGGRVEVFHRGIVKGLMKLLDFNSAFSSVMTGSLPYGKPVHVTSEQCIPIVDMVRWLNENKGMYTIKILKDPMLEVPLLPLKTEHGLTFPHMRPGTQVPYQDYQTLITAFNAGYRFTLVDGYQFQYHDYMANWVKKMYQDKRDAKLAGDKVAENVAKLVLNSCYGSFGTNPDVISLAAYGARSVHGCLNNTMRGGAIGEVHNSIWFGYEKNSALLDDVNVAIASTITSRARLILWEAITTFNAEGYQVLYCDTDSICVKMPANVTTFSPKCAAMIDRYELGALKDETAEVAPDNFIVEATLVTAKGYSIRDKYGNITSKMKGVSARYLGYDFESNVDTDYVAANGDEKLVRHRKHVKLYMILRDILDGTSEPFIMRKMYKDRDKLFTHLTVYNRLTCMTISGAYNKGIVLPDGTVIPRTIFVPGELLAQTMYGTATAR